MRLQTWQTSFADDCPAFQTLRVQVPYYDYALDMILDVDNSVGE